MRHAQPRRRAKGRRVLRADDGQDPRLWQQAGGRHPAGRRRQGPAAQRQPGRRPGRDARAPRPARLGPLPEPARLLAGVPLPPRAAARHFCGRGRWAALALPVPRRRCTARRGGCAERGWGRAGRDRRGRRCSGGSWGWAARGPGRDRQGAGRAGPWAACRGRQAARRHADRPDRPEHRQLVRRRACEWSASSLPCAHEPSRHEMLCFLQTQRLHPLPQAPGRGRRRWRAQARFGSAGQPPATAALLLELLLPCMHP